LGAEQQFFSLVRGLTHGDRGELHPERRGEFLAHCPLSAPFRPDEEQVPQRAAAGHEGSGTID
jgi:hypothetical protein